MEKSSHYSQWSAQDPGNRTLGYSHNPLAGGDLSFRSLTSRQDWPTASLHGLRRGSGVEEVVASLQKCRKENFIICLPCCPVLESSCENELLWSKPLPIVFLGELAFRSEGSGCIISFSTDLQGWSVSYYGGARDFEIMKRIISSFYQVVVSSACPALCSETTVHKDS